MNAMQNKLQLWQMENKQLYRRSRVSQTAVEPLKVELGELELMSKDQQDKICAVKVNILKNKEKIQKMVYSINLTLPGEC